jgi:hypothetical protein
MSSTNLDCVEQSGPQIGLESRSSEERIVTVEGRRRVLSESLTGRSPQIQNTGGTATGISRTSNNLTPGK